MYCKRAMDDHIMTDLTGDIPIIYLKAAHVGHRH